MTNVFGTQYSTLNINEFNLFKHQCKKDLNIACIVDPLLYEQLACDANLFYLAPNNWASTLEQPKIDFFLVNSARSGLGNDWTNYFPSLQEPALLESMISICKEKGIPTVFWDTSPFCEIELFSGTSGYFDLICVADKDSYGYYTKKTSKKVLYLPVCTQPQIFNPYAVQSKSPNKPGMLVNGLAELIEKTDKFSFLDRLSNYNPIVIDSRYKISQRKVQSIGPLSTYANGYLKNEDYISVLKEFKSKIMFDWSLSSRISQQREILETVACGGLVIYIGNLNKIGWCSEFVIQVDDENQLCEKVDLLNKKTNHIKNTLHFHHHWRKIAKEHSILNRLHRICCHLNICLNYAPLPLTSTFIPVNSLSSIDKCIKNYKKKYRANSELILIINGNHEDSSPMLNQKLGKHEGLRIRTIFYDSRDMNDNINIVNELAEMGYEALQNNNCYEVDYN